MATRSRGRKPAAPPHVTTISGDTAHITAVDPADTPVIARRLLDHADRPGDVRTVTTPNGWLVPVAVATAAGLG